MPGEAQLKEAFEPVWSEIMTGLKGFLDTAGEGATELAALRKDALLFLGRSIDGDPTAASDLRIVKNRALLIGARYAIKEAGMTEQAFASVFEMALKIALAVLQRAAFGA